MSRIALAESPGGLARAPFGTRNLWTNWTTRDPSADRSRDTTSCGYKTRRTAYFETTDIKLRYPNGSETPISETDGPAQNTYKGAILVGSTIHPATWAGVSSVTVAAGATSPDSDVVLDSTTGLPLVIAAGNYYQLSYVQTAGSAGQWPANDDIRGLSNGDSYNPSHDITLDGAVSGSAVNQAWGYGPIITGRPTGRSSARTLAIYGDSIYSTVAIGGSPDRGIVVDACTTLSIPYVKLASSGDSYLAFATTDGSRRRRALVNGLCSDALFGSATNDLAGGHTTAEIAAAALVCWTNARTDGALRVYAATCTPRSTGGADTQTATETVQRVAWQTWLRAGAPIHPTTKLYVAVGTPGALLAGHFGHPLTAVLDVATSVEASFNSGTWIPSCYVDGAHPSAAGVVAMTAYFVAHAVFQGFSTTRPNARARRLSTTAGPPDTLSLVTA